MNLAKAPIYYFKLKASDSQLRKIGNRATQNQCFKEVSAEEIKTLKASDKLKTFMEKVASHLEQLPSDNAERVKKEALAIAHYLMGKVDFSSLPFSLRNQLDPTIGLEPNIQRILFKLIKTERYTSWFGQTEDVKQTLGKLGFLQVLLNNAVDKTSVASFIGTGQAAPSPTTSKDKSQETSQLVKKLADLLSDNTKEIDKLKNEIKILTNTLSAKKKKDNDTLAFFDRSPQQQAYNDEEKELMSVINDINNRTKNIGIYRNDADATPAQKREGDNIRELQAKRAVIIDKLTELKGPLPLRPSPNYKDLENKIASLEQKVWQLEQQNNKLQSQAGELKNKAKLAQPFADEVHWNTQLNHLAMENDFTIGNTIELALIYGEFSQLIEAWDTVKGYCLAYENYVSTQNGSPSDKALGRYRDCILLGSFYETLIVANYKASQGNQFGAMVLSNKDETQLYDRRLVIGVIGTSLNDSINDRNAALLKSFNGTADQPQEMLSNYLKEFAAELEKPNPTASVSRGKFLGPVLSNFVEKLHP